jgi:pimeloyl-ACP methyl ester carboxylesterase
VGLALCLLSACSSIDAWQRQKIYRPTAVQSAAEWQRLLSQRPDIQALTLPTGHDGEQLQVLQLPANPGLTSPVRVLFLHGNYRHAFQNLAKATPMQRAGLDVVMPDYRGWGASSPRLPSEESIHEDAWAVWQSLRNTSTFDGRPVRWVIYGHSMGSAVAVRLASRLQASDPACALVLESAFTSFPDVAEAGAGWFGRALTALGSQRMASIDHIGQVAMPVWFLHGSRDDTVPPVLGRRLYEQAPQPRHWHEWPLGHSNLQTDPTGRYDQVWRDIAAGCGGP